LLPIGGRRFRSPTPDAPPQGGFAKELDFLSIDAYYPLDVSASATAAHLEEAWGPGVAQLERIAAESGMPVVVTEVGTASRRASFRAPSAANLGAPLDLEAQRRYYEASCNALRGAVRGMYWWHMTPYIPDAPLNDMDFDPTGKPAEAELPGTIPARTSPRRDSMTIAS
jgi:hypothetical protein